MTPLILLTFSVVQEIIWKSGSHSSFKKNPAFFMELDGSLPCSQKPTIGPYPEPAESSSPHRSLSAKGPAYCYPPAYV
jgi:hypothetical protein